MITGVNFASIPVKDQERALAFYTGKLGFKVFTDQAMGPGQRWIELRIGNSETRVVLFTAPGHEDRVGGPWPGSLGCDDLEATHRQLSARGVTFKSPPKKEPWGTYAIMVDTEGNEFVISGGK
jgi:predicted enzyme related to lactoylglutathione lyase